MTNVFSSKCAYSTTICKIQGQTLGKVIIWLDCPFVPVGAAYVALLLNIG